MKKLFLLFLFIGSSLRAFAQPGTTIFYDDNFGTGGTLSYDGEVNGKPSYAGPANGVTVTVTWSSANNRWEIDLSDPGVGLTFINSSASSNPPDLTLGTWTNLPMDGTELEAFSGTGTTNILPVELISFIGKITENGILLNWKTASELNNEKFEIEESRDGKQFQKIGERKGNGTINEQQEYSFKVENSQSGISYFRLKQVDYDGQFEYSKIVSVNFKGNNDNIGGFYPNPASDRIQLTLNDAIPTKTIVKLYDTNGRLAYQSTMEPNRIRVEMDVSTLANGVYVLQLQRGQDVENHRFVKN